MSGGACVAAPVFYVDGSVGSPHASDGSRQSAIKQPAEPNEHMESDETFPITPEHRQRLATILSEADIGTTLQKIARAGASELLDYCTGRVVPTTMSELRANRLNYLRMAEIRLPQLEQLASALFQVPSSTAARLIRIASSRFAYEWNEEFTNLLKETLEKNTKWIDSAKRYEITITSALVRDWIDEKSRSATVSEVEHPKKGGCVRVQDDTYDYLCKLVSATMVSKKGKG